MALARIGNFDPFPGRLDAPLFCFRGENETLIRERVAALQAAFARGGAPDLVDIDGDALAREPFALADEIGSPSLFSPRRFLRVTLGARAAADAFANALPALERADGVLVAVDAGSDARHEELVNLLKKEPRALVVLCGEDTADDLAEFACKRLSEAGVAIDRDLARELVDLTDAERALLRNELEKLSLLAHGAESLSPEQLRATVADEAGIVLDDAVRRVFAGDARAAIEAADRTSAMGGDAAQIAGAALRTAVWSHRNAANIRERGRTFRRTIAALGEIIRLSRSSSKLCDQEAERVLVRIAQGARGETRSSAPQS